MAHKSGPHLPSRALAPACHSSCLTKLTEPESQDKQMDFLLSLEGKRLSSENIFNSEIKCDLKHFERAKENHLFQNEWWYYLPLFIHKHLYCAYGQCVWVPEKTERHFTQHHKWMFPWEYCPGCLWCVLCHMPGLSPLLFCQHLLNFKKNLSLICIKLGLPKPVQLVQIRWDEILLLMEMEIVFETNS